MRDDNELDARGEEGLIQIGRALVKRPERSNGEQMLTSHPGIKHGPHHTSPCRIAEGGRRHFLHDGNIIGKSLGRFESNEIGVYYAKILQQLMNLLK
jgi:hypothetical protein